MKKQIISEEVLKMQKIAGIITEGEYNTLSKNLREEDITTQNGVDKATDSINKKVKGITSNNPQIAKDVVNDIKNLADNFITSGKTDEWDFFKGKQGEELKDYKKQFIYNEIGNRINTMLFNSGSGSYVRSYSNGYEVVFNLHKALVNSDIKGLLPDLEKSLQRYIEAKNKQKDQK